MRNVNSTFIDKIRRGLEKNNVSAVISSNMAIGVNVFFNTLKKLAPLLYDYDIEIIEAHHNQKKDAPSGTAMTAFEVIAEELGRDPEEVGVYGRQGMVGKRTKEEIGVHAVRGGDIVGDHTVMFVGEGERLEVRHQAHTREVFIAGVIRAIRYVPNAEKGIVSIAELTDRMNVSHMTIRRDLQKLPLNMQIQRKVPFLKRLWHPRDSDILKARGQTPQPFLKHIPKVRGWQMREDRKCGFRGDRFHGRISSFPKTARISATTPRQR